MGPNYLKDTEPLRGDSLLFTIQSPGVPGTHLINFGGRKGWIILILKPPGRFESGTLDWKPNASTTRVIGKTYFKC